MIYTATYLQGILFPLFLEISELADPNLGWRGGVIWGVFSPPKTGLYYFKTNSDDSSVMWVGGEKVVDNSTPHGMRVRTGTINLEKGKHYPILMYFAMFYVL